MNRWCAATLRPERASQYCKDWRPRASTLTLGGRYHLTTYVSTTPPLINAPIARTPECRRWADHHNANATFIEINQLSQMASMACRAQSQSADAATLVPNVVVSAWQGFETDNESSSSSESHSVATQHRRPVYIKPRIELIGVIMNTAPFEINNIRSPRLPSSVWCPLLDPSIIVNDTFYDGFSRPPLSIDFMEQIKDNVPSFQDTAIREWVATARALATSTRDDLTALDLIHYPQWKSTMTKLSPVEVRRCWERVCGFESTILNLLRSILIHGGDVGRRVTSPRDTCTAWFDWNTLATAAHDHNITTGGDTKEMISMLMGTAKYTDSAVESDSCEALRAWYQEYPAQRRKDLLKFLVATFDALNTSPEVKGY